MPTSFQNDAHSILQRRLLDGMREDMTTILVPPIRKVPRNGSQIFAGYKEQCRPHPAVSPTRTGTGTRNPVPVTNQFSIFNPLKFRFIQGSRNILRVIQTQE